MRVAPLLSTFLICFISAFGSFELHAQVVNTETLEHNNVSAVVGDEGGFFASNSQGTAGYEIPKGSGKHTIYTGSIWIGAEDINGAIYVSGSSGGNASSDGALHSGPIANQSAYQSLDYQNEYGESIWKISQQEIDNHIQNYNQAGYVIPQSILDWPGNGNTSLGVAQQLAPYVDINSDGIYSPTQGDYPDIRGDEAVYIIVNDKSYMPEVNSLGIEVHMMFYQYHTGNYFSNTTFLNTRVYNRSTTNYYNFKESLYLDFDIGNPFDDYIGCDSSSHVVFAYNGDAIDEDNGGSTGYGVNPPCQGVVTLSHELHSFGYYSSGSGAPNYGYPYDDSGIWNVMNSRWGNGTPWTYGGNAFDSTGVNAPTNFIFNGNPYTNTGWTELNATNGNSNPTGDRRGVLTIAEDEFASGAAICADFAFIYDKTNSHLQNVQNVINIGNTLRLLYENQFEFPCNSGSFTAINESEQPTFELFPNPSNGLVTIEFENTNQKAIRVINMSGQVIESLTITSPVTTIDLSGKSGMYVVSVEDEYGIQIKRLIIE
jgi:hypothetical protein